MEIDDLVTQLEAGDASAGPMLVSIVAPRLLGYAAQIARDAGEADREQMVEQAIEKAVDKIDQFDRERGSFSAWVRRFVHYEALTWRRAQPPDHSSVESLVDVPDDGPPPELGEASRAVAAIVLSLPEPSQLLVRLRFAERLDHAAIAEQLGVEPAAARKRLERLLSELRRRCHDDPDLQHLGGDS